MSASPVVDPEAVERLAKAMCEHDGFDWRYLLRQPSQETYRRFATAVVNSDWLAEVRREAAEQGWDEGRAAGDCECGHSLLAHPSDDYRRCCVRACECDYYAPPTNPYRREEQD